MDGMEISSYKLITEFITQLDIVYDVWREQDVHGDIDGHVLAREIIVPVYWLEDYSSFVLARRLYFLCII
jgi:hypothetical protein